MPSLVVNGEGNHSEFFFPSAGIRYGVGGRIYFPLSTATGKKDIQSVTICLYERVIGASGQGLFHWMGEFKLGDRVNVLWSPEGLQPAEILNFEWINHKLCAQILSFDSATQTSKHRVFIESLECISPVSATTP